MIEDPQGDNRLTITGIGASADLPPGTRLAGRFTIKQRIGTGGMGVVYRAHDDALGITVALKLLRPELAARPEVFERFRRELLLARQVSSPRVVRIHDIAQDEGRWFISMDFVDGPTLGRWLDGRGPVPVEQVLALARQISEGLQAMHERGIVHRDLKPSNILLDADGNARIGDFGVARSIGSIELTHTGTIVGTPDYLAPEQARGDTVDARADLYALGLILYEMLAGEPAFAGATPAESIARRLTSTPADIESRRPEVPRWLARVIAKLLKPNPAHRFPDAATLLRSIDERRTPRSTQAWVAPLAGLAAAGLLVAAFLGWRSAPPTMPASGPPPPPRIVIVAEPRSEGFDPLLEGAAETLRLTLADRPELAVVDGERTGLARTQSTLDAKGAVSDQRLSEHLGATRIIRLSRRIGDTEGVSFVATLSGPAIATPIHLAGSPLREPAEALRDLLPRILDALDLQPAPESPPLRGDEDLVAYGLALDRLWTGHVDAATDALAQIVDAAPSHAPALASLIDAARQAGRRTEALQAARRIDALPGRPFSHFAAPWRAALEGRGGDALALASRWPEGMGGDPQRQLRFAELALEAGQLQAAKQSLSIAVTNDPQDPRAWFLLGKAAILHGDARTAVEDPLVRALVLFKRARHQRGEAETANALGVAYARLGQIDDAEKQYANALVLRRGLGDRRGTASSLRNLAQIDLFRGRHADAAERLEEASRLFTELGDDAGRAAVENEFGLLHEEQGDYAAALAAYRRGLRSRERSGDPLGVAESLNNIGFAHHQLGDYENAQALWRQAREAFAGLEDSNGLVRVDQNLGLLDVVRGNWSAARRTLDASLSKAESLQMVEEAAVSLRNLVELDLLEGRLDDATQRLGRARGLFESRGDRRGQVDAALLAARIALTRGGHDEAIATLDALPGGIDAASPEQAAIAALLRAHALAAANRANEASKAAAEADALANRSGIRALQLEARMLTLHHPDPILDDAIRQLGHVPLQLAWLERRAGMQIAAGAVREAEDALREAESLLGPGQPYARQATLETLAARIKATQP